MRLALCALGGLLALLPGDARAQADPTEATLLFVAPPGCPTRADLVSRLDAAVGGIDARAASRTWMVAIAVSEPSPSVFRAQVRTLIGGVAGERDVDAGDCGAAIDAAVLVVALALADAEAAADAPEASVEPADALAPPVEAPAPPVEAPVAPAAPPPRGIGAWLGAGGGAVYGPLPDVALGLAVRLDLAEDAWRLGVGVAGAPRGAIYVADQSSRIDLGLVAASLRGCLEGRIDAIALGGCALVDVGAMLAASSGLEDARTVVLPWVAVGLGGTAAWIIDPRVRLEALVSGAAVPTRPRLTIGTDVVHQPEPVAVAAIVSFAVRLE